MEAKRQCVRESRIEDTVLSGGLTKMQSEAPQKQDNPVATHPCKYCGVIFSSRNKMFKHVRELGTPCFIKATEDGLLSSDVVQKKQRVAIVLSFIGTEYSGMQDQGEAADTIERHLKSTTFPRMAHNGTIKTGYTRAARTDKGVSAVCQVVSLNSVEGICSCRVSDKGGNTSMTASTDTLEHLNQGLPPAIRVLNVTACPNDFDARRNCERRRYEYLIPISAFPAQDASPDGTKLNLTPLRKALKAILARFRGTHCWRNFTNSTELEDNQLQRHVFHALVRDTVTVPGECGMETTFLCVSLSGEGFLYHMCRKIVGLAFAVAAGRILYRVCGHG